MCVRGETTMWTHGEKMTVYKPRREVYKEAKLAATLTLDSSLQSYERINFSCLSNPVFGILLWQLKLTSAVRIVGVSEGGEEGWNQGGP